MAPAADASAHRAAHGEDHADEQGDDADTPEGGELGVHDGDEQQDDAENDDACLLTGVCARRVKETVSAACGIGCGFAWFLSASQQFT